MAFNIADLEPGDRVRCYDNWNGTVVQVALGHWLGDRVSVQYDHDQGVVTVYSPHVQPL